MKLKSVINALIYLSIIFGVILLVQLYGLVPRWLLYSVLCGLGVYVVVAMLAATGRNQAYPAAMVLAILTLIVSLPQPEHYAYVQAGLSLATTTFLAGSVLQILLIILDGLYLIKQKSKT